MASSDVLMVSNEWIDALCVISVFLNAFTTACLWAEESKFVSSLSARIGCSLNI
jgi:hypothetical protein